VNIDSTKYRLPPDQYFREAHPKDMCVLHFTAGSTAAGAYRWWVGNEERVATAYLVDLDGTVYEVFPPRSWAYHLGIKGTGGLHDKRSVGIEIVNVGPLKFRGETLYWWPNEFTTKYCDASESAKWKASAAWRGYTAWATYTPEQLAVLPELVGQICTEHGIPQKLLPKAQRLSYIGSLKDITGIIGHHNARGSAKTDPGLAFPWEILV